MIENLLLFILGIVVGFLGSFFGIGGGVVLVPCLIFFYNLPANLAVGTSLAIIFLSSAFGVSLQSKSKGINFKIGLLLSIATIPSAFIATYFLKFISVEILKYFISFILIIISFVLFFKKNKEIENQNHKSNYIISFLLSSVIGIVATLSGIGGGIFQVPQMTYLLNLPIVVAISTSQFIIMITSFTATLSNLYFGNINHQIILQIFFGSIFGNLIAIKVLKFTQPQSLKKLFAIFILISIILLNLK